MKLLKLSSLNLVENKPQNPWTFENKAGARSNIDITLANNLAHETIAKWKVGQGLTTSDHNIYFDILGDGDRRDSVSAVWGYEVCRANWSKLKLSLMLPTKVEMGDDIDKKTRELITAIKHSIPRVKSKMHERYKPWSNTLQKLLRKVNCTRHICQKIRMEVDRRRRLLEYQVAKEKFKLEFRKTRQVLMAELR